MGAHPVRILLVIALNVTILISMCLMINRDVCFFAISKFQLNIIIPPRLRDYVYCNVRRNPKRSRRMARIVWQTALQMSTLKMLQDRIPARFALLQLV